MLISNKLNITYNAIMPNGQNSFGNAESNMVNTEILSYSVSKEIHSDKTTIREDENARNTVSITNNSQTKIFNNFFQIPQLNDANYVKGSVKINGIVMPDYDPVKGFVLPDLLPNETIIIEYELKANHQITTDTITHYATLKYTVKDQLRGDVSYTENTEPILVKVISDKIQLIKSVDKLFAVRGENLHYTINIINVGNVTKTDMLFKDPIPYGTTFVQNSVKMNGVVYPAYNPTNGFVISSLAPSEVLNIEFDVKVN